MRNEILVVDDTSLDNTVNIIKKIQYKLKIPYKILNISSNKPKKLRIFLELIEKYLNKKAKITTV